MSVAYRHTRGDCSAGPKTTTTIRRTQKKYNNNNHTIKIIITCVNMMIKSMCIGNGMEWRKKERKKENERRGSSHREHRIHTLHVCQSKRKEVGRTHAAVNFEYFFYYFIVICAAQCCCTVENKKRFRSGGELFFFVCWVCLRFGPSSTVGNQNQCAIVFSSHFIVSLRANYQCIYDWKLKRSISFY